jgi:glycosyltransferase involved in cell wall biosynthesis
MRILLIDQFGEPGGAQRGLLEAAAGFAARGWELHAALPRGPVAAALAPLCGSVTRVECGPFTSARKTAMDALRFGIQLPAQARTISKIVERENIDVLYVNGPRMAPAASLARNGRPLVYHAHSIVPQALAAALTGRALQSRGATLLASSQFVARWLQRIAPGAAVRVIYNGIAGFAARPRKREAFTRIAILGRIAPEKGQLAFVRAARIAARSNASLTFRIGGAAMFSDEAYFATLQAEAGPKVVFTGWVDDVGGFLKETDLLVVSSQAVDANPRVIPEAYCMGVPVVAFDGGGTPELIEHGVTGLLVNPHNPEALAAAILDAIGDPERLNSMVQRAYARWRRCYTLERFQSEVCAAVEDAAGVRRRELASKVRASATA